MPQTIIDLLEKAANANHADPFRRGNVIHLPAKGWLVATGDIHGHRRNFERIVTFADLQNNPQTHVVLQEIIHGGPKDSQGRCLSHQLLFDVARYKLRFSEQVHIIMANHDIAFFHDSEVVKNGREMNRSINSALHEQFQQNSERVREAINKFLYSQPLAVRCQNRIWLSHSLPSDRFAEQFDPDILNRPLTDSDTIRPGSTYLLIWGRNHSQQLLDKMAKLFDVDIFILGHQAQEQGWSRAGENLIIIASDHNHGCLLPIELAKSYTIDDLTSLIVPLTSIP